MQRLKIERKVSSCGIPVRRHNEQDVHEKRKIGLDPIIGYLHLELCGLNGRNSSRTNRR